MNTSIGTVYKKATASFTVRIDDRPITCSVAMRLRKELDEEIVVGDEVEVDITDQTSGQIVDVLPRRNKLARRSAVPMPSARPHEQVIVSNIDQVVPVFSAANPPPRWNMLDRYLVSAESAELPSIICISKVDLAVRDDGKVKDAELLKEVEVYRKIGYPVVIVSSFTGEGLDEIKAVLKDKISVMVGKSGVGKTSLLNALQPGLGLRVNEVSKVTGKGQHTTTHMEMFPLPWGGAIVDTPGVREFGLWDVEEDDLALYFPEMAPFVGQCKFGLNCQHDEEPGCAVRKAVMSGIVSPRRYKSYMRLKEELV
jgi:ribosome biogenesis GTPase / thiamine phosphate phosphatase